MKKILLLMALCLPLCAAAQSDNFKRFEFEIGGGYPFAASKKALDIYGNSVKAKKASGGWLAYLEGRYNLKSMPLDVGMQINISRVVKDDFFYMQLDELQLLGDDVDFNSMSILPFADYSFRRGKKVNPFVGLGLGIKFSNIGTGIFNDGFETNFCAMPRVGVRFFRHITVSVDYELTKKMYSHANLKIGVSF